MHRSFDDTFSQKRNEHGVSGFETDMLEADIMFFHHLWKLDADQILQLHHTEIAHLQTYFVLSIYFS